MFLRKRSLPILLLAAVSLSSCSIVDINEDMDETMFSFGLRFFFGEKTPELVGAARNTTTDENSDVTGFQADIAIPLSKESNGKPTVRVLGLFGEREVLGQAGIGYNFGTNQTMFSAGVQIPNFEAGFNVEADGKFNPFAGVNTFEEPTVPIKRRYFALDGVIVGCLQNCD